MVGGSGACVVMGGHAWSQGHVWLLGGHAWTLGGVHGQRFSVNKSLCQYYQICIRAKKISKK